MLRPNFGVSPSTHIDAASEASTDSDDNYQASHYYRKITTKQKVCSKDKAKSSLCRNYSEKGYCPYGYKCQFAHGIEELKCHSDENSYKTKPCISFWRKGYCPYGFRCNFSHLHNEQKEQESENEQLTKARHEYREIIYEAKTLGNSRLANLLA